MSKHTPGPWSLNHTLGRDCRISGFVAIRPDDDKPPVAYVAYSDDAHLIAAAPDLLAACKAAAKYIRARNLGASAEELRAGIEFAIAKAEGR